MDPEDLVATRKYEVSRKKDWDAFVVNSKNGIFLFARDYMDYHSDRFEDHSLMFFDKDDRLLAIMPANQKGRTLFSHAGLTFGGVVSGFNMTTATMLGIFDSLLAYMEEQGLGELIYKAVPWIYHKVPAQEDLYALFRNEARLIRRDVASAISLPLKSRVSPWRVRKRAIKRGVDAEVRVEESTDYESFISLEAKVLMSRHNVRPVHTDTEIRQLASKFPEEIKLYRAIGKAGELLAVALMFIHPSIAHVQYLANSDEGKTMGAVDVLLDHLINNVYADKAYFDFGISTEQEGKFLNEGLSMFKESFGGRAIVHDFYELRPRSRPSATS